MSPTKGGRRQLVTTLLLYAASCAALHAVDGDAIRAVPDWRRATEAPSSEQDVVQPCTVYYRADDVTEMNDEIRRCLIQPGVGTPSI